MSVVQKNDSDRSGRKWAHQSDIKEGDDIELDGGFSCRKGKNRIVRVKVDDKGSLYFDCNDGQHHLSGQVGKGGYLIGIYKVEA